jgi:hypothetical protein
LTDPTYAIYLDLDGVMADYDAGIRRLGFKPGRVHEERLNRSGTDDPFKRSMYEAIRGTDFYRALPFMPGALDLYRAVASADPIILTAAPKFGATEDDYHLNPHWLGAAYHKRAWVEERLLPAALPGGGSIWDTWRSGHSRISLTDERFICTTSVRKQQFINRKHSDHQILIDDRRDNCVRWARAGGVAILHTDAATTRTALFHYLDPGARPPAVPDGQGALWHRQRWLHLRARRRPHLGRDRVRELPGKLRTLGR